jgi:Flp pilus assembly protein TadD
MNTREQTDEIYSAEESPPVKKEKAYEKKYLARMKSSSPVAVINNRAVSLLGSGRPAEAEVLLTEALSEEKNEAAVYNNLGVAMEMSGRRDTARKMYQKACNIDPDEYFIRNLDTLDRLEAGPDRSGDK